MAALGDSKHHPRPRTIQHSTPRTWWLGCDDAQEAVGARYALVLTNNALPTCG
jgi:hypothetical protein